MNSDDRITRRRWIGGTLLAGGAVAAAAGSAEWLRLRRSRPAEVRFAGEVPFEGEGAAPLDIPVGSELDGRLYTDLSHLDAKRLATPTHPFYIRTRVSRLLDSRQRWSIRISTRGGARRLTLDELNTQARPQGLHLMECAGNTRAVRFGMIGVAGWDGVPLAPLLDRLRFAGGARILVSGFDRYAEAPRTPSVPGASWIFSRQDIEDAQAFLATGMNGRPLAPDHGAPVRLVLPGWYGCACIKWVNAIAPAGDAAEPTSQMREYAARTMQHGMPERARDYHLGGHLKTGQSGTPQNRPVEAHPGQVVFTLSASVSAIGFDTFQCTQGFGLRFFFP